MYESHPLRGQVDQLRMPLENVVRRPELGEYRQNHEYRDDCGPESGQSVAAELAPDELPLRCDKMRLLGGAQAFGRSSADVASSY